MLIHLTPRFYTCERSGPNVDLVDLNVVELGLTLQGGIDLAARRPYPNKRYIVGCRKTGAKAIDGILLETRETLARYTVRTRWAVDADFIVTHHIEYVVMDTEFDTITDDMTMWSATCADLGGWRSRWPDIHQGAVPCNAEPRMQLSPDPVRTGAVSDYRSNGIIVERAEIFHVPTIERARLTYVHQSRKRVPSASSAFRVQMPISIPEADPRSEK